jgi:hypothetical protein
MYTRETINELNALSREIFGTTSKWKKMCEQGVVQLLEEDTTLLTIKDGKEVKETVKTPVYFKGKSGEAEIEQSRLHRYTVEEVREFMLMVKDRRAQVRETIRKLEEQKKAQEAARTVVLAATGTSA